MSAQAVASGAVLARRAAVFWGGGLAFGLSAVAVLAVLSHRLGEGGLAGPSAVMALSLAAAVLPGTVQLRAAASAAVPVPWRTVAALTGALLAAAPGVAFMLALPPAAVALVAAGLPPAVAVAARRGAMIAEGRLGAAGANLALEAVCRLVAGIWLGTEWGAGGVAAALLLASCACLAAAQAERAARRARSEVAAFGQTLISLGAIVLLVNADLLVAQRALGKDGADLYDVAAVPAKGVFLALFAASWLAVPAARERRGASLLAPVAAAVAAGALMAGALVALSPLIDALLGRGDPDAPALVLLALAMAMAGGTAVASGMAAARGSAPPWPALLAGALAVAALALAQPSPRGFAAGVLAIHAGALAAGVRALTRGST